MAIDGGDDGHMRTIRDESEDGHVHHYHRKVGKLLMSSGGRRQGRAVRSVEAMLPSKGDRWCFSL